MSETSQRLVDEHPPRPIPGEQCGKVNDLGRNSSVSKTCSLRRRLSLRLLNKRTISKHVLYVSIDNTHLCFIS